MIDLDLLSWNAANLDRWVILCPLHYVYRFSWKYMTIFILNEIVTVKGHENTMKQLFERLLATPKTPVKALEYIKIKVLTAESYFPDSNRCLLRCTTPSLQSTVGRGTHRAACKIHSSAGTPRSSGQTPATGSESSLHCLLMYIWKRKKWRDILINRADDSDQQSYRLTLRGGVSVDTQSRAREAQQENQRRSTVVLHDWTPNNRVILVMLLLYAIWQHSFHEYTQKKKYASFICSRDDSLYVQGNN